MKTQVSLPIDSLIADIQAAVLRESVILLQASPGAGKTTRVPPAVMDVLQKQVLVLEPRRLAARLSAERICAERGFKVGAEVGFQIRFENVASAQTRLKFITEGLLVRYLMSDARLSNVDCVILDEFHERHVHTDIALSLLLHLQNTVRPDLKIIIMSATLDIAGLSTRFPQAKTFESKVPTFPVEVRYENKFRANLPLEEQIHDGVEKLLLDPKCPGHILVFLPGAAQINRAIAACGRLQSQFDCALLPLYGALGSEEQHRIFDDIGKRKIIFSTNIAETSLTIPGVTGVVDSGLAKVAGYAPWSGMPTLDVRRVSQASCVQRAGRAGRTLPGVALRLFSEHEFRGFAAFEKPEIQRLELTQTILELKSIADAFPKEAKFSLETLPWFEPPDPKTLASCLNTLRLLRALDEQGNITPLGKQIANAPVHPRIGKFVIEAKSRGAGHKAALCAALLAENVRGAQRGQGGGKASNASSDLLHLAQLFEDQRLGDAALRRRVKLMLDTLEHTFQIKKQIETSSEQALTLAALSAFADRVAAVRKGRANNDVLSLNLCMGGGAKLSKLSVVQHNEFLIAIEGEEEALAQDASSSTNVVIAWGIEQEELLDDPAGLLKEVSECRFDDQAERVRLFQGLYYGNLILEETVQNKACEAIENKLVEVLKSRWPKPFEDADALEFYNVKRELLQKSGSTLELPDLFGAERETLLKHICQGKVSYAEILEQGDLNDYINTLLPYNVARELDEKFPAKITLRSGRKVTVHYEPDKPPWIASPLQDYFGTLKTPAIGGGRVPLVVHLLAPNKRAVQVTTDLEGFWERAYPEVRKELSRRYPRHYWPEDPKNAEPPLPKAKRNS